MTAINCIATPKIGFMVSDSLAYDETSGIVTGVGPKVFTCPHSLSVYAARGEADVCRWLGEIIGAYACFDHIEQYAPEELRAALPKIEEQSGPQNIEVTIMGWSHAEKRVHACIGSSRDNFTFQRSGDLPLLAPMLTPEECDEFGIELTGNPPRDLLKIIKAQRAIVARSGPDENGHYGAIGGAVVMTTLTGDGISQRLLMAWPDRVGERIGAQQERAA